MDITNEQMMQFCVEKAGEKWHKDLPEQQMCACGYSYLHGKCEVTNPSPTDMNELMRLVKILINIHNLNFDWHSSRLVGVTLIGNIGINFIDIYTDGKDEAEALLKALYKACGGKDE